jgi:hypothetical protein
VGPKSDDRCLHERNRKGNLRPRHREGRVKTEGEVLCLHGGLPEPPEAGIGKEAFSPRAPASRADTLILDS